MEPPAETDRLRLARYRRMQRLATGLLAIMAMVFIAASLVERRWPLAGWVRAFAEAAVVGGCADWFAVTALFRRPFGLPIPHTGIVPRNKDRIGDALGGFIAENFLSEAVLTDRLRRIHLARWGGEWLGDLANAKRLARQVTGALPDVLAALPPRTLQTLVGSSALAALRAAPAADIASRLLTVAWSEGRAQAVIERGAGLLRDLLAEHREVVLEKVQAQSYRWLPGWVDRMIARKITAGIVQSLEDVCDPAHPWRVELEAVVQDWARRLAVDPELRARAEALKLRVLEDPQLLGGLDAVWRDLGDWLIGEATGNGEALTARLAAVLSQAGAWLRENQGVQTLLSEWAAANIRGVIAPRRHEIGRFIADVVKAWDAELVVEKLEHQVGRDLQYIRINGTLVGGLAGLAIHALSRVAGLS